MSDYHFFTNRYFNDQEIKNSPKSRIESKQNVHTISFAKIDLPEDGVYKCVATNTDGTVETQGRISVCSELFICEKPPSHF